MSNQYTKGVNWGKIDLSDKLSFKPMEKPGKFIMDMDPNQITHLANNHQDIILHMQREVEEGVDQLTEVRFHFVEVKEEEGDDESGKKSEENYVKGISERIRANYLKNKSPENSSIVTFNDISLAVPRSKYSIDLFPKTARFHGKTYSFSFNYSDISRSFILPTDIDKVVNIVIKFRDERPIFQGQTPYNAIILLFKLNNLEGEPLLVNKSGTKDFPHLNNLKDEYTGKGFKTFTEIFKIVAQISFIAPNLEDFSSREKRSFIKCGIKAQQGLLYFLKKSILFIHKPITYIRLEEIEKVCFNRVQVNIKQFDIIVKLKGEKNENKKSVEFTRVESHEIDVIREYFEKRAVNIAQKKEKVKEIVEDDGDDDEDDESFVGGENEESESDGSGQGEEMDEE